MLQIPVEGGDCGGDLTIKHQHGDIKVDQNEQKFYLSASFIDCVREIAPVVKGWSVVPGDLPRKTVVTLKCSFFPYQTTTPRRH